jgi:hypothetical protein
MQTTIMDEKMLWQQHQQMIEDMANMRIELNMIKAEVTQLKAKTSLAEVQESNCESEVQL